MKWKDIEFFDNKIVCELIEGKNPPGIFRVLDDVCRSVHAADQDTTDAKFLEKLSTMTHPHFNVTPTAGQFTLKHYAGKVVYTVNTFVFKNKDTLFPGLILALQESQSSYIKGLFPEDVSDDKRAPTTAGFKLRTSAQFLVERLSRCHPHYIRCIKSNDKKIPMNFDTARVQHQVKYLGLLENVKVKRSGYAYRNIKQTFLNRYCLICTKTDMDPKPGSISEFITWVKANVPDIPHEEIEEGKTKVFVKTPETIFILEELLYKRTDPEGYALKVAEYKEREKVAQQQSRQGRYKKNCVMM